MPKKYNLNIFDNKQVLKLIKQVLKGLSLVKDPFFLL